MKEPTYRVEWCEVGGTRQDKDFPERIAALAYREWLKINKNILYSSVCKVEQK